MNDLADYVGKHTIRLPKEDTGLHDADLVFFKIKVHPDAKADELRRLVLAHQGAFMDLDLFDGQEHSYLQVGGWIGDQGYAMCLMALGSKLGLWQLLTPKSVLGERCTPALALELAGAGMITIRYEENPG